MNAQILMEIYNRLFQQFGPQYWWPGQSRLEIIVGAILTQNTNWKNVEKALQNLTRVSLLSVSALQNVDPPLLAETIRPAGYYNIKSRRLKAFFQWLSDFADGDLDALEDLPPDVLRQQLLSIKGIGPETADSIILYGFNKPVFVVDAYTARILIRHRLIESPVTYYEIQELFESALTRDPALFNEYHALLVRLGKEYCRKRPQCSGCPLESMPHEIETEELS